MHPEEIITATLHHVRGKFNTEGSGHDWWHIQRVWDTALKIAGEEKADTFVVSLAALLHDIADHKFHGGDDTLGPKVARNWLEQFEMDPAIVDHVCEIVANISFKGAGTETPMATLEGEIVQDADRLDALGAIGIARVFAYAGHKGHSIYNPDMPPQHHATFEEYKEGAVSAINHFYEKLLLLKDRMNTDTGKKMAAQRHQFMEAYLEHFYQEWEGKM